MNYNNLRNEGKRWPAWLVWTLLIICIFMIIALAYSIFLYKDIQHSKTVGNKSTIKTVKSETDVKKIMKISLFNGFEQYHVVEGKTKNGKSELVFVPKNKKSGKITVVSNNDILSRKAIQKQWQQECDNCKLIKITPAISKKHHPLWEVTYLDKSQRYIIDYLNMSDGDRYERFSFKRLFD